MSLTEKYDQIIKAYASEPDPIYPGVFHWPGVKPLKTAFIATDLGPRAGDHMTKKSHFYVTGYDCPNLHKDYQAWEDFLVKVCKRGCSFTYFLGKENETTIARFKHIAEASKAKPGQIQIFVRNHEGSPLAESYADQWKTFHFAIFEDPRQLWIETNHPEGQTEAYDCYYLPPKIAKEEPLLDIFKSRLELVIKECCGKPAFKS